MHKNNHRDIDRREKKNYDATRERGKSEVNLCVGVRHTRDEIRGLREYKGRGVYRKMN